MFNFPADAGFVCDGSPTTAPVQREIIKACVKYLL